MQIQLAVTRVQMFPSIILNMTNKRERVRGQNKWSWEWQLHAILLIYAQPGLPFFWTPSHTQRFVSSEHPVREEVKPQKSCSSQLPSWGNTGKGAGGTQPRSRQNQSWRGWGTQDAMLAHRSCPECVGSSVGREQRLGSLPQPHSPKLSSQANSSHSF